MSLKCFSKHVQSLIDSDMAHVEVILNENDLRSITAILSGIKFIITAPEGYPFSPPIISCINSKGISNRIYINAEWSYLYELTTIIYILLHDYIPNIILKTPWLFKS